jgi:uncharacterized protein (DUF433 family)
MKLPQHIEAQPGVMAGKPCFQGTRIPVFLVLDKLAAGETERQILAIYRQLLPEHITAAHEYAAQLAADQDLLART